MTTLPCQIIHRNFGLVFTPSPDRAPHVIVTVQHCGLGHDIFDGIFEPSDSPSVTDLKTFPLAMDLFRAAAPHVGIIYNQFNRRYVETNVQPTDAYRDERLAGYYDAFHQEIEARIAQSFAVNGPCTIIDLHGFGEQPAHVPPGGYDAILGTGNRHTVRTAEPNCRAGLNNLDFQLRDELEKSGLSVFCPASDPARQTPDPFNGGYLIRKHSVNAGQVAAAIQIELAYRVRDRADGTNEKRAAFIEAMTAFIKRISGSHAAK